MNRSNILALALACCILGPSASAHEDTFTETSLSPERALLYQAPAGWTADAEAASERGLIERLKSPSTGAILEIAYYPYPDGYQSEDPLDDVAVAVLGRERLRCFTFELERWRPWQVDPELLDIIGLSSQREQPKRQVGRHLFIDAGEGVYAVTLTAATELLGEALDHFWRSLRFMD